VRGAATGLGGAPGKEASRVEPRAADRRRPECSECAHGPLMIATVAARVAEAGPSILSAHKGVDPRFFPPSRTTELIGGKHMPAEPQSAAHYTAIQKTARALAATFGSGWEVRTQGPIRLDNGSEPEPDVAVVPGSPDETLTVEVAESSLETDRIWKGSLYARAWLAEYWVLNLTDRVLEVYRKPAADPSAPFGWRYAHRDVLAAAARVTPLAASGSSIGVAALLP
jgi:hypothetical protein